MSPLIRAVVTGGGGFLGSRIVSMLLDEGCAVRSFSRHHYPNLSARGVTCHVGDLADASAVSEALREADVVFHVAAHAGMWGDYARYYATNVVGTQNVIDACRQNGVKKLVHTSTPSVVFGGRHIRNANETVPIARKHLSHYASTKAEAERMVIAANGPDLATVALRPHTIWGPGDNQIFPRLVERHLGNRLMLIGRGDNLVDTTYVDNAARAHLDAARQLAPGSPPAGCAYFISQGDPRHLRDMLNEMMSAAELPPVKKSIPFSVAYVAACVLETFYRAFRVTAEPSLTRFLVLNMARDHYFDITAARRDLGYNPAISIEEGMQRLRQALSAEAMVTTNASDA